MSNSYFRCKQFTVEQNRCVMKVCTDSCLFGAWAASWLQQQKPFINILDIGAGTGLLSLMLAQKKDDVHIDAAEIDEAAAWQARENFRQSPWADKLAVKEGNVKNFFTEKRYDFIISNPPFYENDLLSEDENKNTAHHHTSLSLRELLEAVTRLLSRTGGFAVLLPPRRCAWFENMAAEAGFFINQKTRVKPTETREEFRVMLLFSYQAREYNENKIIIKNEKGNYTPAFTELLKDYYLYL